MTTAAVSRRARRHRGLFWVGVVVAVALLVGGSIIAWTAYAATGGPDGAVRGYFAALQRGDAPAALAFGDIPSGPRTLLSKTVLREQLDIAPIDSVHIVSTDRSGDTAHVVVQYVLGFASGGQVYNDTTVVRREHGAWKLAASAVPVHIELAEAADRATLAGTAITGQPVLLFPGAIPVHFDTPMLALAPDSASLQLNSTGQADLAVVVTAQGQSAVTTALKAALPNCLAGAPTAATTCPRPSPRAVPDSLRGALVGAVKPAISVADGAAGTIDVTATVTVRGTYQLLDFNNLPVTKTGTVSLPLHATTFATDKILLTWADDES